MHVKDRSCIDVSERELPVLVYWVSEAPNPDSQSIIRQRYRNTSSFWEDSSSLQLTEFEDSDPIRNWIHSHIVGSSLEYDSSTFEKFLLQRKVQGFQNLKENWAGPDTILPSIRAIDDGLKFIGLLPSNTVVPKSTVAADGEINFYWRKEGKLIDVSLYGDGYLHYYVCFDHEAIDEGDSPEFGHNHALLPNRLLNFVKEF